MIPTSSIYHHFGSMEQLYQLAQGHAYKLASDWCAARLRDFEHWPSGEGPDALATAMATLIDDWSRDARALAFAWAQCHLLAYRDPGFEPALNAWRRLWADFWTKICTRAGYGAFSRATAQVCEGTSQLHLIRWNRAIDRGALDELCRGWGQWLTGSLASEGPWRRLAREMAIKTAPLPSSRNANASAIAQAAAAVVENGGISALTHRAVAERAGVSLGVVSYAFRTGAELAQAAFEAIYLAITAPAIERQRPAPSRAEIVASWRGFAAQPQGLAAMEELSLAVARDASLVAFGPQMRYLRGRTSGLYLAAHLGVGADAFCPVNAAIYSSMVTGQRRALIGCNPEEIHAGLDEGDALIERLRA